MAKTTIAGNQRIVNQSVGLFAANANRKTWINNITGKMPQGAEANAKIKARVQSSNDYPIVECHELKQGAGDEVIFDFIQPVNMVPIMGDEYAVGKGVGMEFTDDRLRVDQARFVVNPGSKTVRKRTVHDLRKAANSVARNLIDNYSDQCPVIHMAGARGFLEDIRFPVPLAADPRFARVVVNPVRCPSRNRHFVVGAADTIAPPTNTAGDYDILTTDLFTMETVENVKAWDDEAVVPLQGCKFKGDAMAADSPLKLLYCSPLQYRNIVNTAAFKNYLAQAMARSAKAGNNPVFAPGNVALWDDVLIIKMPWATRFFAGDEIRYCASTTSQTEETGNVVPAAFGTTHAVDRAMLVGAQAVAKAVGGFPDTGIGLNWQEEKTDFGDKLEIAVGLMCGFSKIQWKIDLGKGESEYTDNGVCVFDTAVKLSA